MKNEDPKKPPVSNDDYYGANAKFAYYRDLLNNSLKGKNPKGYDKFFADLGEWSRKEYSPSKNEEYYPKRTQFVEEYDYQDYLTPQDVKDILKDDYQDYMSTLRTIRDFSRGSEKAKKLYGEKEIDQDVETLNYGKRFATIPATTSRVTTRLTNGNIKENIEDMYTYDPKQKKVNKITVKK